MKKSPQHTKSSAEIVRERLFLDWKQNLDPSTYIHAKIELLSLCVENKTWGPRERDSILVSNWAELLVVVRVLRTPAQLQPAVSQQSVTTRNFYGTGGCLLQTAFSNKKHSTKTQFTLHNPYSIYATRKNIINREMICCCSNSFTSFRTSAAGSLARENRPWRYVSMFTNKACILQHHTDQMFSKCA